MGDGSLVGSGYAKAVDVSTSSALYQKFVVMLRCGGYHCLALTSDNVIVGWGNDLYGNLGYGSTLANRNYPVASLKAAIGSALIADLQALSFMSVALTGMLNLVY